MGNQRLVGMHTDELEVRNAGRKQKRERGSARTSNSTSTIGELQLASTPSIEQSVRQIHMTIIKGE